MSHLFRYSQTGRLRASRVLYAVAAMLLLSSCIMANWPSQAGRTPQAIASQPEVSTPFTSFSTPTSSSGSSSTSPRVAPSGTTRAATISPQKQPLKREQPPTPTTNKQGKVTAKPTKPYAPSTLVVDRLNLALPVLALPLQYENGNALFPVPPSNQQGINPRWTTAWWRDGAKPGSGQGVVHFDVHTYQKSSAAGNSLGGSGGARIGDIIKLRDGSGIVQSCYKVTEVALFDPAKLPERLWRTSGPAGLAIEFCWDSPDSWGQWLLRKYVVASATACA